MLDDVWGEYMAEIKASTAERHDASLTRFDNGDIYTAEEIDGHIRDAERERRRAGRSAAEAGGLFRTTPPTVIGA